MARSVLVTKRSVSIEDPARPNVYLITLNLQYLDGAAILIDKDFTQLHQAGDNIAARVARFTAKMQAAIDNYKAQEAVFKSPQLDAAVTNIQNGLTV